MPTAQQPGADGGNAPPTIEVRGVILGGDDGLPLDRPVKVVINDGEEVASNADGTFQFAAVRRPYDVTVVDAAGRIAITYLQVSRPDPTLILPHTSRSAYQEASLAGRVEGGYPEGTPEVKTAILLDLPGALWPRWTPAEADGSFGMSFDWVGESTITPRVAALQYILGVDGTPIEFGFAATTELTIANGDALESVPLALSPTPGDHFLTGSTGLPDGYQLAERTLRLAFGSSDVRFNDRSEAAEFKYQVPGLEGVHPVVTASAIREGASSSVYARPPQGAALHLELQAAPQQLFPLDGATDLEPTTEFSWTPFESGVHILAIEPYDRYGGYHPTRWVVTADSSVTLPDLSAYGVSLQPGGSYAWNVTGVAPMPSMDAAASPALVRQLNQVVDSTFHLGVSDWRSLQAR